MATECARPGCTNSITHDPSDRRKREYCSNACKQKAYRLRKRPVLERNESGVTITAYTQVIAALDGLTQNQLESIRDRIDIRLHSSREVASLFYFRKGTGVVHLGVDRNVTLCSRETADMTEITSEDGDRICQRCATVRDTKTWWHGWREAFGDGGNIT